MEQCWHPVPGGTAVAAIELARALAQRDDVAVEGVAAWHRQPPPEPFVSPIPVSHIRLPRPLLYEAWHRWRRPAVPGAPAVVHATTAIVPPRSSVLVATVHDLSFLHYPEHISPRVRRLYERGLDLIRREVDVVLCSSAATLADVASAGVPEDRLRHVPLGVHMVDVSADDEAAVRRRLGLDGPYVLFVGTKEPRKNLDGLLAAFEQLEADVDLVVAGPQGWGERPRSMPRVRFLGFDPGSLAPLYSAASAFCYPTLLEGFGLPVLEAMAQGTPVVTSAGTSTEELIGAGGIAVDPRDPTEIAGALTALLDDEHKAAEIGAAGKARAATYTWARTAELVVEAYKQATA